MKVQNALDISLNFIGQVMKRGSRKLSKRISDFRRNEREIKNQRDEDDTTNAGLNEEANMYTSASNSLQYGGDFVQARNIFN